MTNPHTLSRSDEQLSEVVEHQTKQEAPQIPSCYLGFTLDYYGYSCCWCSGVLKAEDGGREEDNERDEGGEVWGKGEVRCVRRLSRVRLSVGGEGMRGVGRKL